MDQGSCLFWIWLSERLGAANRDFRKLIALYDPFELFHAEDSELEHVEGISQKTVDALSDKNLQRATEILDTCERMGISILTFDSELYPKSLREIDVPPALLYCRGTLPNLEKRLGVGTVGTRRMSAYGLNMAYKISYELASVGAVIVSGMAAGIDGVCSAAAIAAGGETVAVLGCGVDVVYPLHHKTLMEEICRHGAIVSEYPPGTQPRSYHFPVRNRIISGLSQGTVVVEAGLGSGSLITARDAIKQGRDVFAFPANLGSKGAEGTNGLLRDGANLLTDTADVLEKYKFIYPETLFTERLADARSRSGADLHHLERLGVIELTRAAKTAVAPPCAAAPQPPEEKPKRRRSGKGATKSTEKREASATMPTKSTPSAQDSGNRAASASPSAEKTPDEVLSSLTPTQRMILETMPDDRAITLDELGRLGRPMGDLIAALTMLEILGLVQKLPGALYTKS